MTHRVVYHIVSYWAQPQTLLGTTTMRENEGKVLKDRTKRERTGWMPGNDRGRGDGTGQRERPEMGL